jgi:hypothetical protein
VAAVGDGEYVIYTALAWRQNSFGQVRGEVFSERCYAPHRESEG